MEKRTDFDGYRIITDEQTSKCGLLNPDNELVVPCVMDEITQYCLDTCEEGYGVLDFYNTVGMLICRQEHLMGLYITWMNKLIEPQFINLNMDAVDWDEETGQETAFEISYEKSGEEFGYFGEDGELVPCPYEDTVFYYKENIRELAWEAYMEQL